MDSDGISMIKKKYLDINSTHQVFKNRYTWFGYSAFSVYYDNVFVEFLKDRYL